MTNDDRTSHRAASQPAMRRARARAALALVMLIGLAAGCAGSPVPRARLTSVEARIRDAKAIDAHGDVRTAMLVELAEEQVALAKNRMATGENARADLLLQRAEADAELATMWTRERMANAAARKARRALEAMGNARVDGRARAEPSASGSTTRVPPRSPRP